MPLAGTVVLLGGRATGTCFGVELEPDLEVYVAGFSLGSVRRFSITEIMASLAEGLGDEGRGLRNAP